MKRYKYPILLVLSITLLGYYTLAPSFHLALAGDDYLSLVDYLRGIGGFNATTFFNLKFFLWHYGATDTIHGTLYKLFGLNARPFYISSFLFRTLAMISFYPLLIRMTKSKLSAAIAMIFFAVMTTGIETTNWVFNVGSYVAIALCNLLFITIIASHDTAQKKMTLLSGIIFFLTIIMQPIRMTGLPLFVMLFEVYTFLKTRTKKEATLLCFRVGIYILSFLLIVLLGNSIAQGNTWQERITHVWGGGGNINTSNTTVIVEVFKNKHYEILMQPVMQLGAIFLPEGFRSTSLKAIDYTKTLWQFLIVPLILFICSCLVIQKTILSQKRITYVVILLGLLWTVSIRMILNTNQLFFSNEISVYWTLLGGYIIIILASLLYYFQKLTDQKKIVLPFLWILCSYILVWLVRSHEVQITSHRYLITAGAGAAILLGILPHLARRKFHSVLLAIIIVIYTLTIQQPATHAYLEHLADVRNIEKTEKIRHALPNIAKIKQIKGSPLVFYFSTDTDNHEQLYHAILFGFPAMEAIQYKLKDYPNNIVYTDNWAEIESAYKDGKAIVRFTNPQKPVPIENIYSYKILNGDKLVNTTEETRKLLQP